MSEHVEFVAIEEPDASGALLIAGMPSARSVGPLAARFLVRQAGMRRVGEFQSDAFPPVASAEGSVVTSPIALWGGEPMPTARKSEARRLLVLTSHMALAPSEITPLAGAVAKWAADADVGAIASFEALPSDEHVEREVLLATGSWACDAADVLDAKPLGGMIFAGFTAALLVRANQFHVPALALFARLDENDSETEAAADLLRAASPLLPPIDLPDDRLANAVKEAENALRSDRRIEEAARRRLEQAYQGYV